MVGIPREIFYAASRGEAGADTYTNNDNNKSGYLSSVAPCEVGLPEFHPCPIGRLFSRKRVTSRGLLLVIGRKIVVLHTFTRPAKREYPSAN